MSDTPTLPRIERIRDCAVKFRRAILSCNRNDLPPGLKGFPKGACDDASLLLARCLNEIEGFPQFDRVAAERTTLAGWWSHAWLEIDGIIVDITADQFPEIGDGPLVTQDRSWHDQWRLKSRGPAAYDHCGGYVVTMLNGAYDIIIANYCE